MTKWAQRNIFLLKRERCTNILRKALQVLDGLVHFHKAVIGTPSWPSVPTKNITLFLIKIYLSNEYLDISSLLAFLDLPLQQIKLICVQLLTHKHSEEAATDFFDSLLLSDINMNDNLQHDFIYESLIQFDQIIKITTIDVWSFYKNKSKQIHAGDSLKAKMATFETIDATSNTLQAIAKATKNFDDSQNQNLETKLRLSNLEKSAKRQEQKTNEALNTITSFKRKNMKPIDTQKNYKGSHLSEPMASPGAQAPTPNFTQTRISKRQLVDLTKDDDDDETSAQKYPFPLHKHPQKKQKQQLHTQKKIKWKAEEIHHYNPSSPALPTPPPLLAPSVSVHSNPFINTHHTMQNTGTQNTGLQNLTNPFHSPMNTITSLHHMKQKTHYPSHKKQGMKKHMPKHHHNKRT